METKTKKTGGSNDPSDLDGKGYSDESYNPGYPIDKSTPDVSLDDVKRGFKEGG